MANTFTIATLVREDLQARLDEGRTFIKYANREYEGEILMKGQSVVVQNLPAQAWTDISDLGADITATDFTADTFTVTVNQAKGINKSVRTIEEVRSAFNVKDGLMGAIAQGLINTQETHFLAGMAADAATANKLYESSGAPTLSKSNIIQYIEEMAVVLDNNSAPSGRILAVSAAIASMFRQCGIFVYTESGIAHLEEGSNPDYAGFHIVQTNRLPANKIIGFVMNRPHFIDQMTEVELNKRENAVGYKIVGESYYQGKTVGEDAKCIVTLKYA